MSNSWKEKPEAAFAGQMGPCRGFLTHPSIYPGAQRAHRKGMQGVSGWWQSHKTQLNYGLGGELCLPVTAAWRWDQGMPEDGDRAGVGFSQCGSGKDKQTERYPQNMPKYVGLPSPSKKRNKSNSWRNQIKATRKSYGTWYPDVREEPAIIFPSFWPKQTQQARD